MASKKVDGEGKGKAIANTRMLRSMDRKTRSDTKRDGSSSKLMKIESPEKKKRKTTKAKNVGAAKKKVKKEGPYLDRSYLSMGFLELNYMIFNIRYW